MDPTTVLWLLVSSYVVLKYLGYLGWCSVLYLVYPKESTLGRSPRVLALWRLLIGILVGLPVSWFGIHLTFGINFPYRWVAIMAPVRWFEWSLLTAIAIGRGFEPIQLAVGMSGALRAWQAGGVLVSFATDAVIMATSGIFFVALRAMIC